MKATEKIFELREEIEKERKNVANLEAELRRLQEEIPLLEAAFINEEDLMGAAEIEKKIAENRSRIENLPLLIKKSRRRIELLEEKFPRLEEEAIRELRKSYFPRLNNLVKKLVECWRATARVEKAIAELREEAERDLLKITSYPRLLLPQTPRIFTAPGETSVAAGDFAPYYPFTKLKKLIENLAAEGFQVEPEKDD